eukprot:gnl/Chilomastix_caulleri/1243.p1 GENE.gnl/Chilomastix_caulleri/1243~~gnl/Chilomastix_caulleri/1243.p1  ORF type:complete len:139 (+),score=62.21 gnl/Chilomastix_caulleri/1243:244-660(+)
MEMNKDVLEELDHDEQVLKDLVAERKKKLGMLEEMIRVTAVDGEVGGNVDVNVNENKNGEGVGDASPDVGSASGDIILSSPNVEIADDEVLDVNMDDLQDIQHVPETCNTLTVPSPDMKLAASAEVGGVRVGVTLSLE